MKKKKSNLFSYLKANGTLIIIDTLLLVVMGMVSIVSFKFFYGFSSGEGIFWSVFWGLCGALLEVINVVLLKKPGIIAKIMAIALVCMSLFIFAIESYQSAPDIAVEDTTYTEVIDNSTKILNDSAIALVNSINKTEGGYGTSNSKMASEVSKLVETSLEVAKTGQEYKQSLSVNKQMEIFKLVSAKVNVDARTLFIGFLFLRGALLELSMIVLAMKSKSVNKNTFDWKGYLISMLPKPKIINKRGRPVGSKTKKKTKIEAPKLNLVKPVFSKPVKMEFENVEKTGKPKRKLKSVPSVQSIVSNINSSFSEQEPKSVEEIMEEFEKTYVEPASETVLDSDLVEKLNSVELTSEPTIVEQVTTEEQITTEPIITEAVIPETIQALGQQKPVRRVLKRGVTPEKVKEFFNEQKKSAVDNEDD